MHTFCTKTLFLIIHSWNIWPSLIHSSLQLHTVSVTTPWSTKLPNPTTHLHERHFPSPIGKMSTQSGSKKCSVCNFGKKAIISKGYKGVQLPRKLTSYMCNSCNVPLCIYPCFQFYHTKKVMKIQHFVIAYLTCRTKRYNKLL